MDIAVNLNALNRAKIVSAPIPDTKNSSLLILWIVLACILVASFIGICGYCLFKRHKEKKLAASIAYTEGRTTEGSR